MGKEEGGGLSQPEMDKLVLRNLFLSTQVLQGLEFMINGCFPRSRKMVKKHREIGSPPLIQALVAKGAFIVIPNHPSSVSIAWSRADLSCEPGFCRSVISLALLHHILHHSTIDPSTIYVALCTTSGLIQQGLLLSQVTSLKDILPLIRLKAHCTFYTLQFTLLHHYSRLYLT